jgi:hypothetical protein
VRASFARQRFMTARRRGRGGPSGRGLDVSPEAAEKAFVHHPVLGCYPPRPAPLGLAESDDLPCVATKSDPGQQKTFSRLQFAPFG